MRLEQIWQICQILNSDSIFSRFLLLKYLCILTRKRHAIFSRNQKIPTLFWVKTKKKTWWLECMETLIKFRNLVWTYLRISIWLWTSFLRKKIKIITTESGRSSLFLYKNIPFRSLHSPYHILNLLLIIYSFSSTGIEKINLISLCMSSHRVLLLFYD